MPEASCRAGESFGTILGRHLSRRAVLRVGLTVGAGWLTPNVVRALSMPLGASKGRRALAADRTPGRPPAVTETISALAADATAPPRLTFSPIAPHAGEGIRVAEGYRADVLLAWGDPLFPDAPAFDAWAQTAAAQERQFGYNADYVAFLPREAGPAAPDRGLLIVSHEHSLPEMMFPAYREGMVTPEQVAVQLASLGLSVVEVFRGADGRWRLVRGSPFTRRITGTTPCVVSGPAAGHPLLRTAEDPSGTRVRGTLQNCSGGKTPWGTILTAEENLHWCFEGKLTALPEDDPRRGMHKRYEVPFKEKGNGWSRLDPRFDVGREPNEPFRFGWVVEFDPRDPRSTPVKRTALGRFRHEAAVVVIAKAGRAVLYSGDDGVFEYVYKYVSQGTYPSMGPLGQKHARGGSTISPSALSVPGIARPSNGEGLLDEGTLFVARFNHDGTGDWLPLVHGAGPLTAAEGFPDQATVLVNARGAADKVGATMMDRPEDIEVHPESGRVYVVLTNNYEREREGFWAVDPANPRAANIHGHVLELEEDGGDHAATRFAWRVFLLCGDPEDPSTYFAAAPKCDVSAISCPDNLVFDGAGHLWIATDGQARTVLANDGLFAVPVEGPERGYLRQFFAGPPGAEITGPEFTPDGETLFVAVQHPGRGGSFEAPRSTWPDGKSPPRPAVVAITASGGGPIGRAEGRAGMPAPAEAPQPCPQGVVPWAER